VLHSDRFTAILDACVLYPAPVRDILLCLAEQQLYQPKWSDRIQKEWKRNLLDNRPDLADTQLEYTINQMNRAFPDAEIGDYASLVKRLLLPDKDDRHVLAAAIRSRADIIITFNLKDFPAKELGKFDVEAVHPDRFIINLIDLNQGSVLRAFKQQIQQLTHPKKTEKEVLDILYNCNLKQTVKHIGEII
jgi:predicted nucleic acid-binding protein